MEDKIEVTDIALEHLMDPKNYGNICCADAVGMGYDPKTAEFVTIYLKLKQNLIEDIKFNTNGCGDTVVAGSLFTEMIKGASLDYAIKAHKKLYDQIKSLPAKQQACSLVVLKAFEAALLHKEKKEKGKEVEEFERLELDVSCEGINLEKDIK